MKLVLAEEVIMFSRGYTNLSVWGFAWFGGNLHTI